MEFFYVLLQVVPIALTAALAPFNILVVILMLLSEHHPIARAVAFLGGFTSSLLIIGSFALGLSRNFEKELLRSHLLVVIGALGVLLVLLGIRQLITRVDADAPPDKWLNRITRLRPLTAFWMGFFCAMFGLKTLLVYATTLGIIAGADLGLPDSSLLIFIVVLTIISTMSAPILVYVARPKQGAHILEIIRQWITAKQHLIGAVVLLISGVVLVFIGLRGT